MAKTIVAFVVAVFTFVSLWGFYFHFSAGPTHGPGLEVGMVAGAVALVGATLAWWRWKDAE